MVLNRATYPDEKDKEVSNEELKKIVQVSVSDSDLEKMKKFKEYLKNFDSNNEKIALKPSKNYYCDITSKKVSKGNAVKSICEYLKINTNEIIAIGDGENDISMFEITPNSIAMENAVPLAKEKAKYQTLSNNENGVAHVLKNI